LESIQAAAGSNSSLTAANTNNTWLIDGQDSGLVNSTAFSGFGRLTGGLLADQFSFTNSGSLTGSLTGSSGANTLSLANRNAPVQVALSGLAPAVTSVGSSAVIVPTFTQITSYVGSSVAGDALLGPATATAWVITGLNAGTVGTSSFSGFEQLLGGDGNDAFTVNASGVIQSISGGNGTDTLLAAAGNNLWTISGNAAGTLNSIAYVTIENLTGSGGDDVFELLTDGQITGVLDAGLGFNTLSYRQRSTTVVVDLSPATPIATSIANLIDSFSMVVGGSANDTITGSATRGMVLVGSAGNDTLTGGSGRDILLGGLGSDNLQGGAGQDILLGGLLSFENDWAGLKAVWQEWQSTRNFVNRRSNLLGTTTGGLNGTYYLRNSTNPANDTLLNDNAVDNLFGGDDTDWYIASLDDIVDTLRLGEERDLP
jgi:Ca2+-binding RTX toxin-like protein